MRTNLNGTSPHVIVVGHFCVCWIGISSILLKSTVTADTFAFVVVAFYSFYGYIFVRINTPMS